MRAASARRSLVARRVLLLLLGQSAINTPHPSLHPSRWLAAASHSSFYRPTQSLLLALHIAYTDDDQERDAGRECC
eukprot:6190308-Pleurochrysis_carterae.AAC.3